MTDVEVEYCVPCGHLDRAIQVQRALLLTLGEELESVTLRTGDDGVFRISVDGEVVHDTGDRLNVDDIVRKVRSRV